MAMSTASPESATGAPGVAANKNVRSHGVIQYANSVKRNQYLNTGEFMDALAEELKRTLALA